MAQLNVFTQDAFSMQQLMAAVEKTPYQPMWLGQLAGGLLFEPMPVRTTVVSIEEREGKLSIIQTSPRGAPLDQRQTEKRKMRNFNTSRIAKQDTITADEVQSIRQFGMETELMQVQSEVARRLSGPSGLLRDVELTWENMRLGAVQGTVLDADGSTIYDWFTEFSITQDSEIDFDLDAASPASGVVRKKCNQVLRQMARAAKGAWIDGSSSAVAICGDAFWDDLTAHKEVRETYLQTQQAADLRNDVATAWGTFRYGNITWTNYRGSDDASTIGVGTDKAKFFPLGAPGVFQVAWSPGEWFDVVNTPGRPVYPLIIPDRDRNAWVSLEVYSYPLYVCTRPGMLQRAKRT